MLAKKLLRAVRNRRPPIIYTYEGFAEINDPGFVSSATVTGVPLGTDFQQRGTLIAISNENAGSGTITGVTIGGVAAKLITVTNRGVNYGGFGHVEFWYAYGVSGTSASVVVTWNGSNTRRGIGVWCWSTKGADFANAVEATASTQTSGSTTGESTTIDGQIGGVAFAAYGVGQSGTSLTWTGVTEEGEDTTLGVDDSSGGVGSYQFTANETARVISVSHVSRSVWALLQAIYVPPMKIGTFVPVVDYQFVNTLNGFYLNSSTGGATLTTSATGMLYDPGTNADSYFLKDSLALPGPKLPVGKIVFERLADRTGGSWWEGNMYYATSAAGSNHGFSESYHADIDDIAIADGEVTQWLDLTWLQNQGGQGGDDWITNTITDIRFDFDNGEGDSPGDFRVKSIQFGFFYQP